MMAAKRQKGEIDQYTKNCNTIYIYYILYIIYYILYITYHFVGSLC